MLAAEGKLKTVKGVSPTGISADGNGLVLSDGQTLPADVIICATGFGAAWSFIRQSHFSSRLSLRESIE